MAPLTDRAQELLAQLGAVLSGPLEAAGFTLALEDELRPVLLAPLREVRAEALEEAARLARPSAMERSRMPQSTVVELDSLARTLSTKAVQLRHGFPKGERFNPCDGEPNPTGKQA